MARFMVLYHAPASSAGQMENATPEQQKEVMDAWAASPEAVTEIVKGHPHFYTTDSSIEVLEVQPIPGM